MKQIVIIFLGSLIILLGLCYAEDPNAPQKVLDREMDYIVEKGDTLWDISERFYGDPFLWPRLWQQNQYITNPHWIHPGDRIRLYPYKILIQEEMPPTVEEAKPPTVEEVKPLLPPTLAEVPELPPPPTKIRLASYPEVYSAGFLTKEIEGIGSIVGSREDRVMLSEGDWIYLTFQQGVEVKKGDRFTIFKVEGPIKHPTTRKVIGSKVLILGVTEIIEIDGETKTGLITLSFDPISRGDELTSYLPPPEEIAVKRVGRPLYGWIVASKKARVALSDGDVVYIDRGEGDEVKPGHLFQVVRRGGIKKDPRTKKEVKLPDDLVARLVVITTQQKTSTALITGSRGTIHVGDEVMAVTE